MKFEMIETERQMTCETHGDYVGRFRSLNGREPHGGDCPKCSAEKAKAAEEEKLRIAANERWSRCEVPAKFFHAEIDQFPPKVAAWIASVNAKASSGPLVLVGDVGTGKTHLAVCALWEIVRAGSYGQFLSALDYGRRVRETWSVRREDTERSLLNQYVRANALVIDELGANRSADESIIQDLIAARYDAGMMPRTIIVSNLAPAALEKAIGARASDRIREGATLVTLTGQSRRAPL